MNRKFYASIFIALILVVTAGQAAFAQSDGIVECSNGMVTIGFTAPSNLTSFNCLTVPASERAADGQPLTTAKLQSAAIVFDQLRTTNPISPEMTVYPISGLNAINPEIYQKAVDLNTSLNTVSTQGIAALTGNLPVLPIQEKTQLMSAEKKTLAPQGIVGVRFLTAFDDAATGVTGTNLVYAFQGITADSTNYISVLFPITHSMLTAPVPNPAEYNWAALPEDGWTPRLSDLDQIIESITVR